MGNTSISWTNKTWNVIRGCRRVSEGCRNCYAERQARRFAGKGMPYEGLVESKLRVISDDEQRLEPRWTGKVMFVEEVLDEPLRWTKPSVVFVNAMSDLFFEELTFEKIAAIYGVMAASSRHTFQILTKRAQRMLEFYTWVEVEARDANNGVGMTPAAFCFVLAQRHDVYFDLDGTRRPLRESAAVNAALTAPWPLPNVWVGVSAENQATADERIVKLVQVPAAIRWVSAEPLLGPIDFTNIAPTSAFHRDALAGISKYPIANHCTKLDWIVAGCESGPYRRECNITWLRDLRNQCEKSGTPFFLKQAEYTVELADGEKHHAIDWGGVGSKRKAGNIIELPYLDGKQHAAFPPARAR